MTVLQVQVSLLVVVVSFELLLLVAEYTRVEGGNYSIVDEFASLVHHDTNFNCYVLPVFLKYMST